MRAPIMVFIQYNLNDLLKLDQSSRQSFCEIIILLDKSIGGKTKARSCKCVSPNCTCKLRKAVKLLAKQRYHFRSNEILV